LNAGIVDHPIFHAPPDMFRLWILLICMAHRHDKPFRLMGGREIHRGELVTSLGALQEKMAREGTPRSGESGAVTPKRQTIQRYLDAMVQDGMIEKESSRKGTFIRLVNFDYHQNYMSYARGRADNQTDSHADNQTDSGLASEHLDTQRKTPTIPALNGQPRGQPNGQQNGYKRTGGDTNESVYPIDQRERRARSPEDPPVHPVTEEQAIWNEYRKRYEVRTDGGTPTHSELNHPQTARAIIRSCKGYEKYNKFESTPAGRIEFVCRRLDEFFAIEETDRQLGEIARKGYRFGDFKANFDALYRRAKVQKGAR